MIRTVLGDPSNKDHLVTRHSSNELLLKGVQVLVVEDNPINQKLIITLLQRYECIVDSAFNGVEALEKVKVKKYDIIFMDLHMPEMNGIKATELMRREEHITTPIIALTAAAMKDDHTRAMAAGMNDFITKPIDIGKLKKSMIYWTSEHV